MPKLTVMTFRKNSISENSAKEVEKKFKEAGINLLMLPWSPSGEEPKFTQYVDDSVS